MKNSSSKAIATTMEFLTHQLVHRYLEYMDNKVALQEWIKENAVDLSEQLQTALFLLPALFESDAEQAKELETLLVGCAKATQDVINQCIENKTLPDGFPGFFYNDKTI